MKFPFYYWFSLIPVVIILFLSNYMSSGFASPVFIGVTGWLLLFFISLGIGILVTILFDVKQTLWFTGISFIAVTLLSVLILIIKYQYFYYDKFSGEALIFQVTKVVFTFLFILTGVLIRNYSILLKENIKLSEKISLYEKNIIDSKKEAELIKREALINSNELIFDAKKKVDELDRRKIELETKLREFLQTELAVLERHEKLLTREY